MPKLNRGKIMIIKEETQLGTINIEIPINQGDIILRGRTEYRINRFVLANEKIFAVNTSSGLWVEIKDLTLVKKDKNLNYYKETNY